MICTAWVIVAGDKCLCDMDADHTGPHYCEIEGRLISWSPR